ncbi:PREDICTED: rRNA 2'-O-methyltransferase fibrillarin-like [Lipotes vexillifer]|uniref:rRNA 2'-O-methyltransferase fibrillarin-like n=1 Tax=Lipotes vexillifer TaxID=118797 RepID=A0A340XIA8_LIPVE|nr:PREDICTED: rRNA 2'-O-methyltransferase fibrillarin-like [Lipotes vexillifer]
MSGVESSRESGMRLLRAGPEWGRPGNAVWGEGREQASEAVQGGGRPRGRLRAGGCPGGGVPPAPGRGPRCLADPRREEGSGTAWGAKGGGGGERRRRRGVFEAAPAPPRKRAGRGRPSGGGHGGAGPQSSSRVGGLRGGSLKPWGEGAGTRLRPTNRVLPPGG